MPGSTIGPFSRRSFGPRVPSSALIAGRQRKTRRHCASHRAPIEPRPQCLPSRTAENRDDLHDAAELSVLAARDVAGRRAVGGPPEKR